MNQLAARIASVRSRGRTAVGLYLIPGFPEWEASQRAVAQAMDAGVAFIEFPVLTETGWSRRTGPKIAAALVHSAGALATWSDALATWLSLAAWPVGVVYPSAWPARKQWRAPAAAREAARGLLLESNVTDWHARADQAERWGAPLVPTVDGTRPKVSDMAAQRLARGAGFTYLSLGAQTGLRSESLTHLERVVAQARQHRPDLPVCCAFGIERPTHVEDVLTHSGADGVVIGTAALAALERGFNAFSDWLDGILATPAQREPSESTGGRR
jgi:tryptophan synthase alpha subunit